MPEKYPARAQSVYSRKIISSYMSSTVQEISYIHGFSLYNVAQHALSMIAADCPHVETGSDACLPLVWAVTITYACSKPSKE